jgi:DNA-directed RNA polymerase specialized sigma24 family protein
VDDATQAGLVKAWSHLHKIKGSIKSWAWGIGRNAALDLIRKDNRRPVDEFDPERDAPIAEAISNEEMPSSLTPEERAFAYEWVEHGSEREVSEALGMSRRAVRKVIAAITDKYQECYAERYQNPGV